MESTMLQSVIINVKNMSIMFVGDDGKTKQMHITDVVDFYAKVDFIERNRVGFDIKYIDLVEAEVI